MQITLTESRSEVRPSFNNRLFHLSQRLFSVYQNERKAPDRVAIRGKSRCGSSYVDCTENVAEGYCESFKTLAGAGW